ncbi:hypothetical protein F4811DRAFT_548416 [Daldinia bambusicola]|nr:hypothetical protein F4811DRAFT_548416 [Daldinia bambusicola]
MAYRLPAQEDRQGTVCYTPSSQVKIIDFSISSVPDSGFNTLGANRPLYLESLPFVEALIRNRLVEGNPESETFRVWDNILHCCFPGEQNFSIGRGTILGGGRADLFTSYLVLEPGFDERIFLIVKCKAPGLETRNDDIWRQAVTQLEEYFGGSIAGGEVFRIDRQCKSITEQLLYFRENHRL